jgi:DNA mismatch endonuclease, patch repair protein
MSRNKGRNTGPEVRLRRALWSRGLRYRLAAGLPGRPDLVFPRAKIAVFVDGCFWHGCPQHATTPKNNAEFWAKKIARTRERDAAVNLALSAAGWRVIRLWEHEIRAGTDHAAEIIAIAARAPGEPAEVAYPA